MHTYLPRLVTAGLLSLASVSTTAAQDGLTQAETARCDQKIQATMERMGIPGLSVAIGRAGQLAWTKGYGYADVENQVAVTPKTVFRLASISKPITAVATMQLVERGKLDLDAPVQRYVADYPKKRFALTTRNLLSHQGGVRHYKAGEIYSTRHYKSVAAGLRIFAAEPLLHEPGDKYVYTTYGFNVIGAAVAGASQGRFVDYLQANIFTPAGMTETREDEIATIIPHRAQGYRRGPGGEIQNARIVDTSNKIPGGGLCGTASDLVRFCHALQAGKLLKPATLDQMWTPARTKDGAPLKYGLGFRIIKARKPRIVGHSGGQPRVSTMMLLRPDEGIAVGLMCNLESSRLLTLAVQLSDLLVGSK